jgi:site-specific recombinase XerD
MLEIVFQNNSCRKVSPNKQYLLKEEIQKISFHLFLFFTPILMKFPDIQLMFRNHCLVEKGLTVKYYRTIVRHMERLLKYLETNNINKVKEKGIREFLSINSNKNDWSSKTYRSYIQSFNTFFKWCVIRNFIKKNPVEKIEKPKIPQRLPRCLTKSEIQKVFESATQYRWGFEFERTRNLAILHTFLYTGIRLNELLNIRIIDLSIDSMEIYINKGKGGKNRIVPIHPHLSGILRGYIRKRNKRGVVSKWLFTGIHSDKRLYEKNIHEICRKISIKSGIKFTPHVLRHTFARLVCDEDMNLYKLKEILGHSNVSTTQIYLSVSREGIKRSLGSITIL